MTVNRLSCVMLAAILAAPLAAATPRGDDASARATIAARFDAALHGDTHALGRLLADDLEYCNFRGECETKQQYIGEIKAGTLKYRAIEHTVQDVKLFADTAVLLGLVTATATRDGVERTISALYLAVLVWRNGRWQLTSWGTTPLEQPPKKMP
jgi:ketosteroid isomerase-like protein